MTTTFMDELNQQAENAIGSLAKGFVSDTGTLFLRDCKSVDSSYLVHLGKDTIQDLLNHEGDELTYEGYCHFLKKIRSALTHADQTNNVIFQDAEKTLQRLADYGDDEGLKLAGRGDLFAGLGIDNIINALKNSQSGGSVPVITSEGKLSSLTFDPHFFLTFSGLTSTTGMKTSPKSNSRPTLYSAIGTTKGLIPESSKVGLSCPSCRPTR